MWLMIVLTPVYSTTSEFLSRKACIEAAASVKDGLKNVFPGGNISIACVYKGESCEAGSN